MNKVKHPKNKQERLLVAEKKESKGLKKASYVRLVKEQIKDMETQDALRKPYDRDEYHAF